MNLSMPNQINISVHTVCPMNSVPLNWFYGQKAVYHFQRTANRDINRLMDLGHSPGSAIKALLRGWRSLLIKPFLNNELYSEARPPEVHVNITGEVASKKMEYSHHLHVTLDEIYSAIWANTYHSKMVGMVDHSSDQEVFNQALKSYENFVDGLVLIKEAQTS